MKKTLLIFIMIMTLIMPVVPVMAATDCIILEINMPQEMPKAGDTFELSVDVKNNPGIYGVEFVLTYDKDKLSCEKMLEGELIEGSVGIVNPNATKGAKVAYVSLRPFQGDKTAVYCEFMAKEDIEEFEFGIIDVYLLDEKRQALEYAVSNGESEEAEAPEEKPSKPSKPDISGGDKDEPEEEIPVETPDETTPEEATFPDVSNHWAKEFVNSAAKQGLFKGDENGNFNPDAPVTRAQFVTVLWRMAGKPEVADETPFTDTKNQISEFKSAIAWGYKNGYINGTSDTTFDPDGTLTREAGMKILHFYSGGKRGNETVLAQIYDGTFIDSKDISDWAKPSVYWGIYNNLISGTSADTLTPKGTATRAQLAKILVNYMKTYTN